MREDHHENGRAAESESEADSGGISFGPPSERVRVKLPCGRKPLPVEIRMDRVFSTRLSRQQSNAIYQEAQSCRLTVSEYMRASALDCARDGRLRG